MSGELQPFDTERYVDELSCIIGELGGIATRESGLSTEVEKLTSEADDQPEPENRGLDAEVKKLTSEAEGILGILWCATCPDREEASSDKDVESGWEMESLLEDMEYMEYGEY